MSWTDRTLGIVLGLLLGVAIVVVFVFEYSEQTIDEPGISGGAAEDGAAPDVGDGETQPGADLVQVVGGLPPESGPAQLTYERGDRARIRVVSDGPVTVVLQGYGITRTVPAGKPTVIEFTASKTGNFPLLSGSIGVAQIRVSEGL